jgi:hypothetical protein
MRHEDALLLQHLDRSAIIVVSKHRALMVGLCNKVAVRMETLEERDSHITRHSILNWSG